MSVGVNVLELGAFGTLLTVFLWMVWWMIHRLTAALDRMPVAMEAIELEIRTVTMSVVTLQKQLLQHDSTVRGINPSVGGDREERLHQAEIIYQSMHLALDDMLRMLDKPRPMLAVKDLR